LQHAYCYYSAIILGLFLMQLDKILNCIVHFAAEIVLSYDNPIDAKSQWFCFSLNWKLNLHDIIALSHNAAKL